MLTFDIMKLKISMTSFEIKSLAAKQQFVRKKEPVLQHKENYVQERNISLLSNIKLTKRIYYLTKYF